MPKRTLFNALHQGAERRELVEVSWGKCRYVARSAKLGSGLFALCALLKSYLSPMQQVDKQYIE